MHSDRAIATIAQDQYGIVATRQAAALGVSRSSLWRRSRTGSLAPMRRGVWRVAGAPRCWEQHALAAVLGGGVETVVSHGAAARIWGFEGFSEADVEVCEARPRSSALTGIRTHHSVVFDVDRTSHRQIPVTSPARTVIDLAGRCTTAALGRLVDEALRRRLVTLGDLMACAARLRPAPGRPMRRVFSVLRARIGGLHNSESVLETRVGRLLLHAAQLDGLVAQHRVRIGRHRYRLDFAQPALRIAHEVDGWAFHRSRTAFVADRERSNRLTAAGWTVLRYTADMPDDEVIRVARTTQARIASSMGAAGN